MKLNIMSSNIFLLLFVSVVVEDAFVDIFCMLKLVVDVELRLLFVVADLLFDVAFLDVQSMMTYEFIFRWFQYGLVAVLVVVLKDVHYC